MDSRRTLGSKSGRDGHRSCVGGKRLGPRFELFIGKTEIGGRRFQDGRFHRTHKLHRGLEGNNGIIFVFSTLGNFSF